MKKLFSMASLLLLAFVMTGCENAPKEITCDEPYILVEGECVLDEVECEDGFVLEEETCVEDLSIHLDFSFIDFDGEETVAEVALDSDFDGTFTDVLVAEFDTAVLDSEYGNLLLSIEGMWPLAGSYIAILKNDEMSSFGIDEILFEDGDEFQFVLTWWDPTAEAVYNAIGLFLENQVENYVSPEYIEYNVFAALNLLGMTEEYVTDSEVESYLAATYPELTTYADYFKVMSIKTSAGLDTAAEGEEFLGIAETGIYGQTALTVIGLDMNMQSAGGYDYESIEFFNTYPAGLADLDGAGLDMIAYSLLEGDMITEKVEDFYFQLQGAQLSSGGVKTADTEWDGTIYPGTENAASMSMVILGLIANDLNPAGTELTTDAGNNLVSRLLEFQTETGTFDWVLGDEVMEDTLFSTPQAFLALVAYHTYINTYAPVNPYNNN